MPDKCPECGIKGIWLTAAKTTLMLNAGDHQEPHSPGGHTCMKGQIAQLKVVNAIGLAVQAELDEGEALDLENITSEIDDLHGMFIRIWYKPKEATGQVAKCQQCDHRYDRSHDKECRKCIRKAKAAKEKR